MGLLQKKSIKMKVVKLSSRDVFLTLLEELEELWFLYFMIKSKLTSELKLHQWEEAEFDTFFINSLIVLNRIRQFDLKI